MITQILEKEITFENIKHTLPSLPYVSTTFIVKPRNPSEALYEVQQLLPFISSERILDWNTWYKIGCILHKMSYGSREGLESWITISPKNNLYFSLEYNETRK